MYQVDIWQGNKFICSCEDVIFMEDPQVGERLLVDFVVKNPVLRKPVVLEVVNKTRKIMKCQFIEFFEEGL